MTCLPPPPPPPQLRLTFRRYAVPPVTGYETITHLPAGSTITLATTITVPLQQVEDTPLVKIRRMVGQKPLPVEGTFRLPTDLTQRGIAEAVHDLTTKMQHQIDQLEQSALQQLFAYGTLNGVPLR